MGEETKQPEQAPPADEASKPAPLEEPKQEEKSPPPPPPAEEAPPEEPKSPSPFVLYVDLHCVGCAKKIDRSIMKLRGVEGVVIDMAKNQVTIKGVVNPQAICNLITKKTRRMAKVLSPLPPTEGEPMPQIVASQVSGLVTVELNVNMHCEACAEQLKKKILKMRGVQSAETEFCSGKVTVTGTMDADKLVDYVYRRTKKQARIVPQPEPEKPPQDPPKPTEEPENPPAEEKKEESGDQPKEGEAPAPAPEEPKKEEGESNGGEQGPPLAPAAPLPPPPVMHMPLPLPPFAVEDEPMKRMMMYQYHYQPTYVFDRIPPAPQLFSDENPNACTIS
ncbi:hypothetical protein V2J09_011330 [Rumex salicifolius]